MAGHSHWAGIKHKKETADKKRGMIFGKLLAAITVAARDEQNPDFNPRLRTAILSAKEAGVLKDKIESAIARASRKGSELEEFLFEAYGRGGAALLIEAISDNRNRIVSEIKKIITDYDARWAESGSVTWAFQKSNKGSWEAKFPQELSPRDKKELESLVEALVGYHEVQKVTTNVKHLL